MHLTNPDVALKTARKRIENALEENSKIIVTACHNCKRILAESSKNLNAGIKVLDTAPKNENSSHLGQS